MRLVRRGQVGGTHSLEGGEDDGLGQDCGIQ